MTTHKRVFLIRTHAFADVAWQLTAHASAQVPVQVLLHPAAHALEQAVVQATLHPPLEIGSGDSIIVYRSRLLSKRYAGEMPGRKTDNLSEEYNLTLNLTLYLHQEANTK